jgi:hypothetical protein
VYLRRRSVSGGTRSLFQSEAGYSQKLHEADVGHRLTSGRVNIINGPGKGDFCCWEPLGA